jgi:hypothetical protein
MRNATCAALTGAIGMEISNRHLDVANRIIFNVTSAFPGVEGMKHFAEVLNTVTSLDVVWDLTVMSHGVKDGVVSRMIEVVLYNDERGHSDAAKTLVIRYLKHHGLKYRVLGEVLD